VYPASKNKSSHWIKENSSVCEITGYDVKKITKYLAYWLVNTNDISINKRGSTTTGGR